MQIFQFYTSESDDTMPLVEPQTSESTQSDDQTIFEVFDLQRMTKDKYSQARLNVHLRLVKSYCLLFNSDSKLSVDGEGTLDKMPKDCFYLGFQWTSTNLSKHELFLAVEQEDDERAKFLLSKGTNPNVRTADNQTPLHLASEMGNLDIVKTLLDKGVDTEVHEASYGRYIKQFFSIIS